MREVKAAFAAQLGGLAVSDWQRLRSALADVQASTSHGGWSAAVERADGTSRMPFPSLSAEADELVRAFLECGLQVPFDWTSWARGKALAADPQLLVKATAVEAAMVIVAQLRADRFVDGHLLGCFDSGLIQQAVERMLDAEPRRVA